MSDWMPEDTLDSWSIRNGIGTPDAVAAYMWPQISNYALPDIPLRKNTWFIDNPGPVSTATPNVNTLVFVPLLLPAPTILDGIAIEVTTVGGAGSVVRLGIYSDDLVNPGIPASLLFESTAIVATTLGAKEFNFAATPFHSRIWLAAVAQVAAPAVRTTTTAPYDIGTTTSILALNVANQYAWQQGSVTGALPATAVAGTGPTGNAPKFVYHVAA